MILVTGATGYVGPFVLEALVRAGEGVRAMVRPSSDPGRIRADGVGVVHGDLEDERSLLDALDGVETLVAASHIRHAPALVRACLARGVTRAVFFSSARVHSKVPSRTVEEVASGEASVLESGLDYTLLRPTMIYGPGDDRNVSRLRTYLEAHRVIPVFGSGERLQQPVYVRDVAQAVPQVLCRTSTIRKTYVLGGPASISYIRMIDAISAVCGRWVLKVYLPTRLSAWLAGIHERRSASPRISAEQVLRFDEEKAFDISEARGDFNFDPVTFEEGLRRIEAERRGGSPS